MQVFIPTYGRAGNQVSYAALSRAGVQVGLVVQAREADLYSKYPLVYVLPDDIRTIAPTRKYILTELVKSEEFCMVDDDLYFFHRREDDPTKLREITDKELRGAFIEMRAILSERTPHIGFAAREGANRNTKDHILNTRIMRVLGYHTRSVLGLPTDFSDMEVMEDFHIALSLLERGKENMILNKYAHNQAGGSGSAGGCSHFRTPEMQARNAELLAKLHPGHVSVVQKETKGAWGGGVRTDVIVHWKKAYQHGQGI